LVRNHKNERYPAEKKGKDAKFRREGYWLTSKASCGLGNGIPSAQAAAD
jgi:hypothetical protein